MSVCSDHKILFYFFLISHSEAKCLSLFILTLGLYPVDQTRLLDFILQIFELVYYKNYFF